MSSDPLEVLGANGARLMGCASDFHNDMRELQVKGFSRLAFGDLNQGLRDIQSLRLWTDFTKENLDRVQAFLKKKLTEF
jgi:hypothetical protein